MIKPDAILGLLKCSWGRTCSSLRASAVRVGVSGRVWGVQVSVSEWERAAREVPWFYRARAALWIPVPLLGIYRLGDLLRLLR